MALDFVIDQQPKIILTGCSSLNNLQKTYNNFLNYQSLNNNYEPLKKVLKKYQTNNLIPCIMCEKCKFFCPEQINIPLLFSAYNKTLLNPSQNFEMYSLIKYFMAEGVNVCTHCNRCINTCPVNINIPAQFRKVFELRP